MMLAIKRIPEIVNTKIFNVENSGNPLLQSAIVEMLVNLKDLMEKAKMFGSRINFTDDINVMPHVRDVTDTITYMRDCGCHLHIPQHFLDETKQVGLSFLLFYGSGFGPEINGVRIGSDYDDEFMLAMGTQKLYLGRHVLRAYEEAKAQLMPFLPKPQ